MDALRETSVWLAINETRHVALACSPHELEALALGHLLAEGWIETRSDILAVTVSDGPGAAVGVSIGIEQHRLDAMLQLLDHRLRHGCGLRHVLDCERAGRGERHTNATDSLPAPDSASLFRALFAAADEASPSGGVHAAALSDGATLAVTAIDVARHAAVDRAIGLGLQAALPLQELGLVLTARVSGSITLKCARAGLGWVASRSISTTLAREIADAFGITIIERAARVGHRP